jgi:acyl-CoA synthetase (AMP-forming)/AMP-acid ligase II/acyl carrier protein
MTRSLPRSSSTVLARLAWWAAHAPDAPALLAAHAPATSHAALSRHVASVGARLRDAGVERSGRVAVIVAPGRALAGALLGVMSTATCCPLDPATPQARLVRTLTRLRAAAVATDDLDGPAGAAARALGVPLVDLRVPATRPASEADFPAPSSSITPPAPEPDDAALILQTSGTTGEPKRVILSHANLAASAANVAASLALATSDRCVCPMPLFHVHGIVAGLLAPLWSGGAVACVDAAQPSAVARAMAALGATWITAVPTLLAMLERECAVIAPRPRLRLVRSASSPLPRRLAERLAATFDAPVIEAYGMTEAAHQVTSNRLPPYPARPGSVGIAVGVDVRVVDAAGAPVPPGTAGEVVIRGPNVATRFESDEADGGVAHRTRDVDEWLRTGDAGTLDAAGGLTLHGRLAQLIDRGGEKIAPREVEDALLEHARVRAAAVFAFAHPTLGHDVAAAVSVEPGEGLDVEELRRFLFTRLPAQKVPKRIAVLDALPTGASGKVDRVALARVVDDAAQSPRVAPRGDDEIAVAAGFAEVLAIPDVGATDHFFLLGGDSLTGMQLLARLRDRFGVTVPLRALFEHDTPAALARVVASARRAAMADAPASSTATRATPPIVRRSRLSG